MEIPFTKLQGNGNDFILIDEYSRTVIPDDMKAEFAAVFCDRHFGIGGDGVLFVSKSESADAKMRLFQPDKSEAEMCGNGIRCFVKYLFDSGYVKDFCRIETLAGIIPVALTHRDGEFSATIDMPTPRFSRKDIPAMEKAGEEEYHEIVAGRDVYAVNVGVPHAIVFVDSVESVVIEKTGPAIRWHESFPKGTNVNFVERTGPDTLRIRTFERGVEGETLSCGTGATASAAVAAKLGFGKDTINVETAGGPLTVYLGDTVKLQGPAVTVFAGHIEY